MQGTATDPTRLGDGTVASFLALHGLVTVTSPDSNVAVICQDEPFHWNGSELVICSIGPAAWSGLEAAPIDISLVAGTLGFQFPGTGATDRVIGVAPEYREQLVTYLGPTEGHAAADAVSDNADTHRFFITPNWRSENADR